MITIPIPTTNLPSKFKISLQFILSLEYIPLKVHKVPHRCLIQSKYLDMGKQVEPEKEGGCILQNEWPGFLENVKSWMTKNMMAFSK